MQPPHDSAQRPAAPEAVPCDYCDQPIIWTVTEKDARMPVDAEPSDHGNVLVRRERGRVIGAVIGSRSKRDAMRSHDVALRTHHRLSCPRVSEWARGRA